MYILVLKSFLTSLLLLFRQIISIALAKNFHENNIINEQTNERHFRALEVP